MTKLKKPKTRAQSPLRGKRFLAMRVSNELAVEISEVAQRKGVSQTYLVEQTLRQVFGLETVGTLRVEKLPGMSLFE